MRALVTGGSGAIGARSPRARGRRAPCLCPRQSRSGARRRCRSGDRRAGGSAEAVAFDVTDSAAAQEALSRHAGSGGAIQILVNNAGIHDDAVMPGMRREQWSRVIDVSLNGFFNVTQPLLMPMIRHALGTHRQHLLGRGARRQSRPDELRGRQGRAARRDPVAGARTREPRHHGQHGGAGHHRLADERRMRSTRTRSTGWCR